MKMKTTHETKPMTTRRYGRLMSIALVGATVLAACGASATAPSPGSTATTAATAGAGAGSSASVVLPTTDNPINNTATAEGLKIDSVLVENNVDAAGKDTSDHLEILVSNTGAAELSGFEVFYTFTETTTGTAESYYTQLPDTFTVPAGGQRIIHFDNTGSVDHFPVNDFSLYATSAEALDVTVTVSAAGSAPKTMTVQKDAGGEEASD